jgi:hypothetical protein
MRHRIRIATLALAVLPAGAAMATEPLAALLGQIAPAKAPEGSVDVVSWIERNGAQPELVVTLVPKGQVKLVADPGMTVTPVARTGVAWANPAVSAVEAGRDYFAAPPTIRVPFAGEDGKPVQADVEYAYCLVDYKCLFGETTVSAPTLDPRG